MYCVSKFVYLHVVVKDGLNTSVPETNRGNTDSKTSNAERIRRLGVRFSPV